MLCELSTIRRRASSKVAMGAFIGTAASCATSDATGEVDDEDGTERRGGERDRELALRRR